MTRPATTTVVSLDDLIQDPDNARVRDARAKDALRGSLRDFGAGRSIVADADGVVLAGNGTLEAAKAAGMREALVVDADGTQVVVVRRKDLSGLKAKAYALADNRTAELSTWDAPKLSAALSAIEADPVASAALSPLSFGELPDAVPAPSAEPSSDAPAPDEGTSTLSVTFDDPGKKATVRAALRGAAEDMDDASAGNALARIAAEWLAAQDPGRAGRWRADVGSGRDEAEARMNRTARESGPVASNAVVPRLAKEMAVPGVPVLDFGAGPSARHTLAMREAGLNVTAYDIGRNVRKIHDRQALSRRYGLVFASNVLNMQPTADDLVGVLCQIRNALSEDGTALVNYPEPRHCPLSDADLEGVMSEMFTVERIGRAVWKLTGIRE